MSAPTEGWYTNSAGLQQWWDGERWGPVAPPTRLEQADTQPVMIQRLPRAGDAAFLKPQKSVGVAYVFLLLLGNFGAHRFYIGSPGIAIIFIVSWVISVVGIFSGVPFGDNPLFVIADFIYIALYIYDLFALAGKVRRYNHPYLYDY